MENATAVQTPELPFSLAEFHTRIARVRNRCSEVGLDALLVSSPENIYYLSGYQSVVNYTFQALLILVDDDPRLIIRYGERSNVWARSWIRNAHFYRDTEDPIAPAAAVIHDTKVRRLGVELTAWPFTALMYSRLLAAISGVNVDDCSDLVAMVRVVKSLEEIAYLEQAARISGVGVLAGIRAVREGATDQDVAASVYSAMILAGGEYPSLPALIAAGSATALFHNTWSGRSIGKGDVVFLEVPGTKGRYLAPVARSACVGPPPRYIAERYRIARESLEAGLGAMRPGVTCGEVYRAFAEPYNRWGYEVPTRVGYSVGLAFPPKWSEGTVYLLPDDDTVLQPGMVFHTPRTVRRPGDQTPIISETTLITETGHRVLTDAPRDLYLC